MASINTLPDKVIGKIIGNICSHMTQRDKLSLLLTCRRLNQFALPSLFTWVTLTTGNNAVAKSFIQAAAKHGDQVNELRIVIPAATCKKHKCKLCTREARAQDPGVRWATGPGKHALDILRGKCDKVLPKLRHIMVHFPKSFGGHEPVAHREYESYDDEAEIDAIDEQVQRWDTIEKQNSARGRAAFAALSERGSSTTVKELTIVNLPKFHETQSIDVTPGWKCFLGNLERFDLYLWAGEEGRGVLWTTMWDQFPDSDGYTHFVKRLPSYFFDHLASVKTLRFRGSL